MRYTVTICSPKGGSGKTTLAIHLAAALARRGEPVRVLDADPQRSALDWAEMQDDPIVPLSATSARTLQSDVESSSGWVIVDTPGVLDATVLKTLDLADLVLIPVQPSGLDVWAVQPLVEQLQRMRDAPAAGAVISRAKRGTVLAREITDALDALGVQRWHGAIADRTVFARAISEGKTVFELDDEQAIFEIEHLAKQVIEAFR